MADGALFSGGPFRIAAFVPDVTIDAVGQDALGITGYPVETGATMTDHSFKLPVRLEMTVGWSDSSAGAVDHIRDVYQRLLALQATRQPFSITTSRRMYRNMLMESITDPISARSYSAMVPRITFRELIISRTAVSSAGTSDGARMAKPENTASVVDTGETQPLPVNFGGNNTTAFGGYDPSLGIGGNVVAGSLGGLQVDGIGTFDTSGLGENVVGTDPGGLVGSPGLFGRYSPGSFANVQPFRV